MKSIPTGEIKTRCISLNKFDKNAIRVISETVWDNHTCEQYGSVKDFKKCTSQDIGYSKSLDQIVYEHCAGKVYKIGEDGERIDTILACRCGFGVFQYFGDDYLFIKFPVSPVLGIMAYQALKYQKISPRLVKYLADHENRKKARRMMGAELYLKVIMSLGIVNEIDLEDSRF